MTFECKDLSEYKDSILFSSGEVIAKLENEDSVVKLIVDGNVRVPFNGVVYKDVSEFPKELIDLMKKDVYWDCDERVGTCDFNWFEFLYTDKASRYCDALPVEIDISKLSVEEMKEEMITMMKWFEEGKS